jgi:hypothetical protein
MYYDLSLQTRTEKTNKCTGQHRILRTGYTGQDNRTAPLGQDVQLKYSVNNYTVQENLRITIRTVYCIVYLDRVPLAEQIRGDRQVWRQDGKQETGQTARDRTGIESKKSL